MSIDRQVRACTPGPGAWSLHEGERIKIGPVTIDETPAPLEPGLVAVGKKAVHVGTGTAAVRLGEVKAFGKQQMNAADWARGVRLEPGTRFGDQCIRLRAGRVGSPQRRTEEQRVGKAWVRTGRATLS